MELLNNKKIIAITGPSGAGKTTLGNTLSVKLKLMIPKHCTTRLQRNDDQVGFYRYFTHEEYQQYLENKQFLITSGDGPEVKKEYGNFYGVLKKDCFDAWQKNDTIILFVSYKDIFSLIQLEREGFDINIVNLTFTDIEKGIRDRLSNNSLRGHSLDDINNRINSALLDKEIYGHILQENSKTVVYTDVLDIEKTYNKVYTDLKFKR